MREATPGRHVVVWSPLHNPAGRQVCGRVVKVVPYGWYPGGFWVDFCHADQCEYISRYRAYSVDFLHRERCINPTDGNRCRLCSTRHSTRRICKEGMEYR